MKAAFKAGTAGGSPPAADPERKGESRSPGGRLAGPGLSPAQAQLLHALLTSSPWLPGESPRAAAAGGGPSALSAGEHGAGGTEPAPESPG